MKGRVLGNKQKELIFLIPQWLNWRLQNVLTRFEIGTNNPLATFDLSRNYLNDLSPAPHWLIPQKPRSTFSAQYHQRGGEHQTRRGCDATSSSWPGAPPSGSEPATARTTPPTADQYAFSPTADFAISLFWTALSQRPPPFEEGAISQTDDLFFWISAWGWLGGDRSGYGGCRRQLWKGNYFRFRSASCMPKNFIR